AATRLIEHRFPHRTVRRRPTTGGRRVGELKLREILSAEDDLRVAAEDAIRSAGTHAFAVQRADLRLFAEALSHTKDVHTRLPRSAGGRLVECREYRDVRATKLARDLGRAIGLHDRARVDQRVGHVELVQSLDEE